MKKLFLLSVLVAARAAGPAPRLDTWKVIGPGGAGAMFLPTVSPHDSNLVLEHCDMTGAYLSLDSGRSWRMFNLRGTVSAFAFDPTNAKTIYAGNTALFRSDDTGKTWRMIFPDPERNTVARMRDDHAAVVYTTADPVYPARGQVRFIAVDPADSKRVYVVFAGPPRAPAGASLLVATEDRGATWKPRKEFSGERIHAVYFDDGPRVVSESAVYAVKAGEWERLAGPPGGAVESASGAAGMLYATNAAGVHLSEDQGKTWRTLEPPIPGIPHFAAIACSGQHPQTAYVAFDGTGPGRSFGIAKTSDGGRHWAPVYRETAGKPAANVERAWIEEFYRGTGPIRDLGVSPTNPDICYATDSCPRSFRTLDGGKTWQQIISQHAGENRWTTTGFDVTTCYGIHFDPFNTKNVFISYTDVGLFKSADGGETWKSSITGIPHRWDNTTYWIDFDPSVKGRIWGAFARTHDLPRPKMWQRLDPDRFEGGVGVSTDGGEHWTVSNQGMPETAVTHILIDPDSPAGSRTIYACGFGRGVYKSTDDGKTWALKINGIEKRQPFVWRITRAKSGALYLVVSRRSDASFKNDAEDGALYRSVDGAETWVKMKLPAGVNGPTGLALDPEDNRRMYLSAWGAAVPGGISGGGVFLSTDAGETWGRIFGDSQHVYDVTVDARHPSVLYNSGFEGGAWRSADRGATWKRIRGFNFKWGHRVIPDPFDPARIYVTTFGGSVWHGPAEGDPNALEDVVTPFRTETGN